MSQDQTKKEALFNEVKGSLFEYLVASGMAKLGGGELEFQKSIDRNYLTVLAQQDRMVRQFYPELLGFLKNVSDVTIQRVHSYFDKLPVVPKLIGKFSNSDLHSVLYEADLLIEVKDEVHPLSLKLNKKNAFVNTKSGGIKSFFKQYFDYLPETIQEDFNKFVDLEFNRMALELHTHQGLEYPGNFSHWVKCGFSELPGEQDPESRALLKAYYARIAHEMHKILTQAKVHHPLKFGKSLAPLMGFSSDKIIQVVCFHEFPTTHPPKVDIHSFNDIGEALTSASINEFKNISSVELEVGNWNLQIRVKPMNKFTTTAIKINCSVKVKEGN